MSFFSNVFTLKLAVSLLFCIGVWYFAFVYKNSVLPKSILCIVWLITRPLPFVLLYLFMDYEPRGDIPFFFYKGGHVLQGGLVYRDFWSYHAPLFSYLLALPLLFWNNAKALVLLMIVGEALCIWASRSYFKQLNLKNEETAKWVDRLTAIYYFLPGPFIIVVLGGQEDAWLWAFSIVGLMMALKKQNHFLLGALLAINLIVLKITYVLILVPVFFFVKDKLRFILGGALVVVPVYLITYALVGNSLFMFIEHTDKPFSPNIFTVLAPFFPSIFIEKNLHQLNWILLIGIMICTSVLAFRHRAANLFVKFSAIWVLTFCAMNLLLPASMIYYTYIYFIPLVFSVLDLSSKRQMVFFLLFNILIVVQPFLFVRLGFIVNHDLNFIGLNLKSLEYLTELYLVAYMAYVIRICIGRLGTQEEALAS